MDGDVEIPNAAAIAPRGKRFARLAARTDELAGRWHIVDSVTKRDRITYSACGLCLDTTPTTGTAEITGADTFVPRTAVCRTCLQVTGR